MKKYEFEGKEYDRLWQIRQLKPNLVFSDSASPELLAKLGITVIELPDPEPDPAELLPQARAVKLDELRLAFDAACQNATVATAGGWIADADETAYRNVQGLLITMQNNGIATVQFCDADNAFHEVTQKELEELQQAIITKGQELYAIKWKYRTAIEQAATEDELAAIRIEFA